MTTRMSLDGKQRLHPKGQQPEKGHCPLEASIHIARTRLTSKLQACACMYRKQHLHPKGQQPEKGHCPLSIHIARTRLASTLQARACMCTPGSFASSTTRALGPLDYHTGTRASCLAPMTTRMIIHDDEDEPGWKTISTPQGAAA